MGEAHWRLFARLLRHHRRALVLYAIVLTGASTLPLIGPVLLGRFVDAAGRKAPLSELVGLASGYIGVGVAASAISAVTLWRATILAWKITDELRHELVDFALSADLAFHRDHSSGELVGRIDADVTAMTAFLSQFVARVIAIGFLAVFAVVTLAFIQPLFAVPFTLVLALVFITLWRHRNDALEDSANEREAETTLLGHMEERLGARSEIRALGGRDDSMQSMFSSAHKLLAAARGRAAAQMTSLAYVRGAVGLGDVVMIGFGAWAFATGRSTVGGAIVGYRFMAAVRDPIDTLTWRLQEVQGASGAARRVLALFAEGNDRASQGTVTLASGPLDIVLTNLTVRYDDGPADDDPADDDVAEDGETETAGAEAALNDVTLTIAAGTVLGIVGRSGSGKTTLARAVLGLVTPTSGSVTIGGVATTDVLEANLRARVAAIPQDVQLFPGTIRDNVTLFGHEKRSDEEIHHALATVGLGDWLGRQADGLGQLLSAESGATTSGGLSSGERQLLATARGLLRRPDVIILDEATSRVDPVTAELLTTATQTLLHGRTAIIIAHRLETLAVCDHIAVLHNGQLVEHGERTVLEADGTSHFGRLLRAGQSEEMLA
jgi:ABC-type multidrug transport system fused ATPase/permease subunit